jgi:predicted transcriptional regulator
MTAGAKRVLWVITNHQAEWDAADISRHIGISESSVYRRISELKRELQNTHEILSVITYRRLSEDGAMTIPIRGYLIKKLDCVDNKIAQAALA